MFMCKHCRNSFLDLPGGGKYSLHGPLKKKKSILSCSPVDQEVNWYEDTQLKVQNDLQ